jgi:putative transposase
MLMVTFQYRLYPTKEQRRLLERQLEECRWLWNTLLAERKQAWEERQRRRRAVARVHERIRWRRGDFAHQASRQLVNQ